MSLILAGIMGSGSCLPVMAFVPNNGVPNQQPQQVQQLPVMLYQQQQPNQQPQQVQQLPVMLYQQQQQGQGWYWYGVPYQQQAHVMWAQYQNFINMNNVRRISREEYERRFLWINGEYIKHSDVVDIGRFDKESVIRNNRELVKRSYGIDLEGLSDDIILVAQVVHNKYIGLPDFANYEQMCEMLANKKWESMSQEEKDRFENKKEPVNDRAKNVLTILRNRMAAPSKGRYVDIVIALILVHKNLGMYCNEEQAFLQDLKAATDRVKHILNDKPYGEIHLNEEFDEEEEADENFIMGECSNGITVWWPRKEYERRFRWIFWNYIDDSDVVNVGRFNRDEVGQSDCCLERDFGIEVEGLSDNVILVIHVLRNKYKGFPAFKNYEQMCEILANKKWESMSREERERFESKKPLVNNRANDVLTVLRNGDIPSRRVYKDMAVGAEIIEYEHDEESELINALNDALGRVEMLRANDVRYYMMRLKEDEAAEEDAESTRTSNQGVDDDEVGGIEVGDEGTVSSGEEDDDDDDEVDSGEEDDNDDDEVDSGEEDDDDDDEVDSGEDDDDDDEVHEPTTKKQRIE